MTNLNIIISHFSSLEQLTLSFLMLVSKENNNKFYFQFQRLNLEWILHNLVEFYRDEVVINVGVNVKQCLRGS